MNGEFQGPKCLKLRPKYYGLTPRKIASHLPTYLFILHKPLLDTSYIVTKSNPTLTIFQGLVGLYTPMEIAGPPPV